MNAIAETGSTQDPILEEVRLFYESHHDGIEASRQRHRYFYDYLTRVFRVRVAEQVEVHSVSDLMKPLPAAPAAPLPRWGGVERSRSSSSSRPSPPGEGQP